MTTTAVYCRLSRDREGQQLGVDRQEADCRQLAARLGLSVDGIFVDNDVSASTLSRKRRPQYEAMMQLSEAGQLGTILAYSNSRLTRRPLELERLIAAHDRTGVRFRTVVSGDDDLSTADGRMVARIKASVDAAESERIGERVRRKKAEDRAKGAWMGGWRHYGFEPGGRTVRQDEATVKAETSRALLDGTSLTALVRRLNEQGVPTATGKLWSTRGLRRMLLQPHPVLDDDTAEAVRALLEDPSRRTTPGPGRRWMLSGLAVCDVCKVPVRGSGSSLGAGRGTYPAYRCKTGKHVVVNAVVLDEFIGEVVVARLSRPDAAGLFVARSPGIAAASTRAKVLRARLDKLADNIDISERQLARRSKAFQVELDALEQQIAAGGRTTVLGAFAGRDPGTVWAGLDLDRRRAVIDVLMTITVRRATPGVVPVDRRWREDVPSFDPRRVEITWRTV